jgi:DNA mismatch endonuclease (patch repair protein)
MADIVSPEVRSRMMAGIKGKNTKPEMLVRRHLHAHGFRYNLARKDLPGRPDLVLRRFGAAIFVHGCYWHGHPGCRYATTPSTRTEFWTAKISGNRDRDARVLSELAAKGWRVAVVWECALRHHPEYALGKLEKFLRSEQTFAEIAALDQGRRQE